MGGKKKIIKFWYFLIIFSAVFIIGANFVFADEPSGNNWFQLLTSPMTSLNNDNTGDGGTGISNDFNYYYVGQSFDTSIRIKSSGTNAANIWIDFDPILFNPTQLLTGNYFPSWAGQTTTIDQIKSTGYRVSGLSSGEGNFGSARWRVTRPTAANYGTSTWGILDINTGVMGLTTESNISNNGNDILEDAEDFNVLLWADTVQPYAQNPNPGDSVTGVAVEGSFAFELRDSLRGEGNDIGVGTGVNTAQPPGFITFNDSSATTSYNGSYTCSGIWGRNLCNTTINPSSPLGIGADQRNWKYDTLYTVNVSGFQDLASPNQTQLGDTPGPNTMTAKTWTFRTEADTVKPRVENKSPADSQTGVSVSTNISFDIVDKKTYLGNISGTGVDINSCKISISSPSFPLVIYQHDSPDIAITPISYGFHVTIDPASDFAQNETVTVNVYDCQDYASTPNVMLTDIWTFVTQDTQAPYVDTITPANDAVIAVSGTVSFHIKDNGGVDLGNTVIYVNGTYYTQNGGAGVVTTNGTRITFFSSLSFEGPNYDGDTTDLSGAPSDYTFVIDPQTDFAEGEAIPVIIYTQDQSGNIMEREVFANIVLGAGCATCASGSSFCGADSTWDIGLMKCIGTGGNTCPPASSGGGGGGSMTILSIDPQTANVVQIDGTSVLVTWHSSLPGSSRVIYDTDRAGTLGSAPNYGYSFSTEESPDNSVYHAVIVSGLQSGKVYFFRPTTKAQGSEVTGPELAMVTKFTTQTIEKTCPTPIVKPVIRRPTQPSAPSEVTTPVTTPIIDGGSSTSLLKIIDIKRITDPESNLGRELQVTGQAGVNLKLKATIY